MTVEPEERPPGRHPDTLTAVFEAIASALGHPFLLMLWPRTYLWYRKDDPPEERRR